MKVLLPLPAYKVPAAVTDHDSTSTWSRNAVRVCIVLRIVFRGHRERTWSPEVSDDEVFAVSQGAANSTPHSLDRQLQLRTIATPFALPSCWAFFSEDGDLRSRGSLEPRSLRRRSPCSLAER
jgi:hypothetical protein